MYTLYNYLNELGYHCKKIKGVPLTVYALSLSSQLEIVVSINGSANKISKGQEFQINVGYRLNEIEELITEFDRYFSLKIGMGEPLDLWLSSYAREFFEIKQGCVSESNVIKWINEIYVSASGDPNTFYDELIKKLINCERVNIFPEIKGEYLVQRSLAANYIRGSFSPKCIEKLLIKEPEAKIGTVEKLKQYIEWLSYKLDTVT